MQTFLASCGVVFLLIVAIVVVMVIIATVDDAWSSIKNYKEGEMHKARCLELEVLIRAKDDQIEQLNDMIAALTR